MEENKILLFQTKSPIKDTHITSDIQAAQVQRFKLAHLMKGQEQPAL